MSAKKGRGRTKVLPEPQKQSQMEKTSLDQADCSTLSGVDKASFMEGLQRNVGMPLHSTAVEEDLHVLEDGQTGKKTKQSGSEQNTDKKKRRRTIKASPQGATAEHTDERKKENVPATSSSSSQSVRIKPAKRRTAGQVAAGRALKIQQMRKNKDPERKLSSGGTSDVQSQEESDSEPAQRRRRSILSSEDEKDEDGSWQPSPKKTKSLSLGRTRRSLLDGAKRRRSSSGGTAKELGKVNVDEPKWRLGSGAVTDMEVVLDAFLNMCEDYRESVESSAAKKSIACFSNNVKEQLLEKISSTKELRVLKRENAKVGSLIRTKTQRLLDVKHELMRAQRQVGLLEKEKAELQQRLEDLRRGQAFLRDMRELTGRYLEYRRQHPSERETYGASSLPALLLETKIIQAEKHQQKGNDEQREERRATGLKE
ncbi:centromere protein U [Oryzias latipes]|uniref:Centromere protein U n=2 Tax=Oryzias latipes TaxID=8090 RepID=H2LXF4_ORYLA|nr:centromere protein U [Oryzias latipes]